MVSGFLFMATIFEALQNAKINICENWYSELSRKIGSEQLKNGVTLLEKGYSLDDEVETLLEDHGDVDKVPLKPKQ